MTKFTITFVCLLTALTACSTGNDNPQQAFLTALNLHCGKAYAGKLVSNDAVDEALQNLPMTMEVRECSDDEIRIPFHIGDNHSRTWVITRTADGLRLKHRHGHEDGTEDAVSQYGGDTENPGTASRQEFPVDQFSKDLFVQEGLDVSVTNIWAVEITKETYAYELRREGRFFRVEFDLSQPVSDVPAPW